MITALYKSTYLLTYLSGRNYGQLFRVNFHIDQCIMSHLLGDKPEILPNVENDPHPLPIKEKFGVQEQPTVWSFILHFTLLGASRRPFGATNPKFDPIFKFCIFCNVA